MAEFFRISGKHIDVFVRLTPRGGADLLEGCEERANGRAHLKARVRAAPEKGVANKELEKLLAAALGLPRSAVVVSAGATSRLKTLSVSGGTEEIVRKLEALRYTRSDH